VRIGVLALQGDVDDHAAMLRRVGAEPVPVRRPKDLRGVAGLVLPGGESTTMAMLLDSSGLTPALVDAVGEGMALLGTCAGMILLAREVLDGRPDQRALGVIDVVVRRNAYGRQRQSFECPLDVPVLAGGPLRGVFIRAPQVVAWGPGVDILARLPAGVPTGRPSGAGRAASPAGPGTEADRAGPAGGAGAEPEAAVVGDAEGLPVLCRQGAVVVASFHPELSEDDRLHRWFVEHVVGGSRPGASPAQSDAGQMPAAGQPALRARAER